MAKSLIREVAGTLKIGGKRGPLSKAALESLASHAHKTGNTHLMKQVQAEKGK